MLAEFTIELGLFYYTSTHTLWVFVSGCEGSIL